MTSPGATWAQMFAAHAHSGRRALVSTAGSWTFRDLTAWAAAWAAWFDEMELPRGRPIPVMIGSGPAAYSLLLAGAFTSRPIAPLAHRLTTPEIAGCVRLLDATVLVADPDHAGPARDVAELAQRRLLVLPDEDLLARGELGLDVSDHDVAILLFTSGTTGAPKAVRFSQSRLGARTRVYAGLLGLGTNDVYSSSQQFHHLGGVGLLMVAMGMGAAVALPAARFSTEAWRALATVGATHATLAPTMIEMLLDEDALAFPGLRMITYGASPIRPATAARLLSRHPTISLLQGYSQTEGGPITALTPSDHVHAAAGHPRLLSSVGRPVRGTKVIIHDPDAAGVGEVRAQADHLAAPQADGWLHTGDMGWLDENGYLYLSGRKGDMIIRGGENVYPEEVERRISTHPAVQEVAVVGIGHEVLGEEITAFIVPADLQAPPSPDELRRYTRAELAGFKVPTQWRFVDALPHGALGKVLRRKLRRDPGLPGSACPPGRPVV